MGKHRENKRKPKRLGKIITVGKAESVPPGRGATVKLKDGNEVALYNVNGEFYALENFCPHKGSAGRFAALWKYRRVRPARLAIRHPQWRVFYEEKLFDRKIRCHRRRRLDKTHGIKKRMRSLTPAFYTKLKALQFQRRILAIEHQIACRNRIQPPAAVFDLNLAARVRIA